MIEARANDFTQALRRGKEKESDGKSCPTHLGVCCLVTRCTSATPVRALGAEGGGKEQRHQLLHHRGLHTYYSRRGPRQE